MHFVRRFIGIFAFLAVAATAPACQVPVFRYALERWEADAYPVVAFHDGEMTDGQKEVVHFLSTCETDEDAWQISTSRPLTSPAG